MVMIETAPERRPQTIESSPDEEPPQPRRPRRQAEPVDVAPEPLVQIETRK